ncbi:MAG: hypothetical protein ACLS8R_08285 [Anaeromassilibacillus sp.]
MRFITLKYLCGGPAAKPIIDILAVVWDVNAIDALPAMEALGYEAM